MAKRKYKKNGVEVSTALNKNKKYKYDSTGDLVEFTGDPGVNEITLAGSKSSLRRMADMERNISILATTLTTTDDGVADSDTTTFDSNVNKKTRFKKEVRIDTTLNMQAGIDMNGDKITDVGAPTSGGDAANKTYTDATAATAKAEAISEVTNGAGAAFDTLKEIQDAMATDSELSSAISSVTSSAASTAAADATSKANAAKSEAITEAVATAAADATSKANTAQTAAINAAASDATSKSNTAESNANTYADTKKSEAITISYSYTDTAEADAISTAAADATTKANAALASAKAYADSGDADTTYTAGNGMSLSGTSFAMSGSYTGSFTATGDITAYSDDTLKTNVQVIDGALGKVNAVRGVTFDRISDGSTSTGVIAQELKAVLPEAVHTDAEGVHSVAYGNITGLLIEAVKELSAQVEELKKK